MSDERKSLNYDLSQRAIAIVAESEFPFNPSEAVLDSLQERCGLVNKPKGVDIHESPVQGSFGPGYAGYSGWRTVPLPTALVRFCSDIR